VEVKTFLISGDMGDVVYAIPTIKACGGGRLYLDASGGAGDSFVQAQLKVLGQPRLRFSDRSVAFISSLVSACGIEAALWSGEPVDVNLNAFRTMISSGESIPTAISKAAGLYLTSFDPWISVDKVPVIDGLVVSCSRSFRHTPNHLFWMQSAQSLSASAVFLGTDLEHSVMEEVLQRPIRHQKCSTALETAGVIASTNTFVGNISLPMAIAEGLGMTRVVETHPMVKCPHITKGTCRYT
jgi:hypothetical protein